MIPFDFILDYLFPIEPTIRKMFGQYGIYIEDKIVLAVCKNDKKPFDNGVWIATDFEHQESLIKQFPNLKYLKLYNIKKWLLLSENEDDFENTVIEICELIKKQDNRIGVTTKVK